MQNARKVFDQELAALKQEVGDDSVHRALLVFSKAVYWLRTWGHGNFVISAVGHKFGLKTRGDTVFSIEDK
jgi:hypothetical protein